MAGVLGSIGELVAPAKAAPGKMNQGSAEPGSTFHMSAELCKAVADVNSSTSPNEVVARIGSKRLPDRFQESCGEGWIQAYRASNCYIVLQALPATLGLGPEVWRVLAMCHNRRNVGEYEGLLDVDEKLVKDLIAAAQKVSQALARL